VPDSGPDDEYSGLHVMLGFPCNSTLPALCMLSLLQREMDLASPFLSAVGCVSFTYESVAEGNSLKC